MNNPERPITIITGLPTNPLLRREIMRCEGWDMETVLNGEREPKEPFRVYICSPLAATARKTPFEHIMTAVDHGLHVERADYKGKEVVPVIPHLAVLPLFNEFILAEWRKPAIKTNLHLLEQCDALLTVGKRISPGMKEEIAKAKELGIPVFRFKEFVRHLTKPLPSEFESHDEKSAVLDALKVGEPRILCKELFLRKNEGREKP